MYGASLSKAVFAVLVTKLVEQGAIDLDTPLQDVVDEPLWKNAGESWHENLTDLRDDPRYRRITARTSLSHTTGMPNWRWFEPDHKLRIHFEPGTRYQYSGEGMVFLRCSIFEVDPALRMGPRVRANRRAAPRCRGGPMRFPLSLSLRIPVDSLRASRQRLSGRWPAPVPLVGKERIIRHVPSCHPTRVYQDEFDTLHPTSIRRPASSLCVPDTDAFYTGPGSSPSSLPTAEGSARHPGEQSLRNRPRRRPDPSTRSPPLQLQPRRWLR